MVKKKGKQTMHRLDSKLGENYNHSGCCAHYADPEVRKKIRNEWKRPLRAEFWGTTMFVFLATLGPATFTPLVSAAVHGLTFMFIEVAWGSVSGGHFNPVITLAVVLCGEMGPFKGIGYLMVQVMGCIAGAAITRGVLPVVIYESIQGGSATMNSVTSPAEGMAVELVFSFLLVLVYLMVVMDTKNMFGSAALGMAVFVSLIAGEPLTGSAINPVRALGPAVIRSFDSKAQWADHWVYWVGPILGSLLAIFLYRFFLGSVNRHVRYRDDDDDDDDE